MDAIEKLRLDVARLRGRERQLEAAQARAALTQCHLTDRLRSLAARRLRLEEQLSALERATAGEEMIVHG